eukprot:CFRG7226T1
MRLAPREKDKLLLVTAGNLAQRRLARGVRLNLPETTALIAHVAGEMARDGKSVSSVMGLGKQLLGHRQVMSGVGDVLHSVQVEATFPDGTKLVTIHDPICQETVDLSLALYDSFLPVPSQDLFPPQAQIQGTDSSDVTMDSVIATVETSPGEICVDLDAGDIILNAEPPRNVAVISVTNMDDRPIQVGSHFHFGECNRYLSFDRRIAYGKRLHVPAGTSVRFEPGDTKRVTLVDIGGEKIIQGGNRLGEGPVGTAELEMFMTRVEDMNFRHEGEPQPEYGLSSDLHLPFQVKMSRETYASMFGPTKGDSVQLGDTSLYIEVEDDLTVYGDECKFGGGKVLRDGNGQAAGVSDADALDTVITNALIVDCTGIYKADIGIKDGNIVGIGKAGNPASMNGVHSNMVVGVTTEVIAGENKIITAGASDTHIHWICPQQCDEAIASGVTTMIGGGTGPAAGTCAVTSTPGTWHIEKMLQAMEGVPVNIGIIAKGNSSQREGLEDQIQAGAMAFKIHEDWGATSSTIDMALTVADELDVQVMLHTDTLNEAGTVEDTIAAFKNRTIHTYHSEGAGGGHAPDIIRVCGEENVLPSSTNPTRPYTTNTIEEHVDMLMVCHHLDRRIAEDVKFAESRIRGETIMAEDILHDLGAISMMSSDSQAMGRVGEVISRTWQTASKMKQQRGRLTEETMGRKNDNVRVKRYISKYTINPAITHGYSHLLGSVEVGKMADLVVWDFAYFGTKPDMVLKSGSIAWSQMGDPNASIPTPQPVYMRPMFGVLGRAISASCVTLVSKACVQTKSYEKYNLTRRIEAVRDVRGVTKKDMVHNNFAPKIRVDPENYKVYVDNEDEWLQCEPLSTVPLGQLYYLS